MAPEDIASLGKAVAVRPVWNGMARAAEVTGLPGHVLLHAGPAFDDPGKITRPILNSACVAAVHEGLATDFEGARNRIAESAIILEPAQDYGIVTPLASVVPPSMWLHVVADAGNGTCVAHAPTNGGSGPCVRDCVPERFSTMSPGLTASSPNSSREPSRSRLISPRSHCRDSRRATTAMADRGDDGTPCAHAFQAPGITARCGPHRRLPWLGTELLSQPLDGAACACSLGAARGMRASSLIVAAGGNGRDFGIKIAGVPCRWFSAPAPPPVGHLGNHPLERALGAIGDSAIVDCAGFGAMAISFAPKQLEVMAPFMPARVHRLAVELLGIEHPAFGSLQLRYGLAARRVVERNRAPAISLGILDRDGTDGRLGGGIFLPPLASFEAAVRALASENLVDTP